MRRAQKPIVSGKPAAATDTAKHAKRRNTPRLREPEPIPGATPSVRKLLAAFDAAPQARAFKGEARIKGGVVALTYQREQPVGASGVVDTPTAYHHVSGDDYEQVRKWLRLYVLAACEPEEPYSGG